MARVIKFKNKTRFFSNICKIKRFSKIGGSKAVTIPKKWAEALDWDWETKIVLQILPYDKKIIISELKDEKDSESPDGLD